MPAGNGTGPLGWGPLTGRRAGFCAGYPVPGYMNRGGRIWGNWWGMNRGRRLGPGWGWNYFSYSPEPFLAPEQELENLKRAKNSMEQKISMLEQEIQKRQENPGDR